MKKIKYNLRKLLFLGIVYLMGVPQIYSQKIIKVGVVYTAKAQEKISIDIQEKAKNQIRIIKDILQSSGIDDFDIEVSYTKLEKKMYEEPKYRKNGYIRFSFDGTYQILDEISNHARLMSYFRDNEINSFDENGINYIDKNELSVSLIGINATSKPNVVLFIADENGPPNISEYFPEDITTRTSKTFFSIINAEAFSKIDISLSLGFFGIFADEDNADFDEDENPLKSTFMSFWEYDDINVQKKLSKDNIDLFKCNLSKLKLTSPEKMEVGGVYIEAETKNSVMEAQNYLTILPASPVNKRNYSVIAPDGDDYSFMIVSKRPRIEDPICISPIKSKELFYIDGNKSEEHEENVIETIKDEFDDINLFASVNVKVYPNPTSGMITYEFVLSKSGNYELALYNNYGQQIKMSTYKNLKIGLNKIKEDYTNLDNGMYIYRLESKNAEPITGKIVLSN